MSKDPLAPDLNRSVKAILHLMSEAVVAVRVDDRPDFPVPSFFVKSEEVIEPDSMPLREACTVMMRYHAMKNAGRLHDEALLAMYRMGSSTHHAGVSHRVAEAIRGKKAGRPHDWKR